MSTQIAVRLPDEMVAFIDALIAGGGARSRAEVVLRALAREQRRAAAERDLVILLADRLHRDGAQPGGPDDLNEPDDLDDLVAWTSAHPIDLDDD